ncbi:MAG: hypothetical protein M1840_001346 [Geoglossum simile]|nr:MAG: hypothetical protein M1840_001346 [Geoglossum simile]
MLSYRLRVSPCTQCVYFALLAAPIAVSASQHHAPRRRQQSRWAAAVAASQTFFSAPAPQPYNGISIDPFRIVAKEMRFMTKNIRSLLGSGHPTLDTLAKYYTQSEGKHMRPLVVLLMSRATSLTPKKLRQSSPQVVEDVDIPISPTAILADVNPSVSTISHDSNYKLGDSDILPSQRRLAEITELIHTASLLHDDVIDHSLSRRSAPSANIAFGNKMAVLAGDFLLGRASVALARLRDVEVIELLATVIANLVEGEFMQLKNTVMDDKHPVWTEDTISYYLQKTYLKSASLLSKSCRAAALLGESTPEVAEAAYLYGKNLGLAFQLVDDMLDYTVTAEELGKPSGADLELGLATAPLLFAWRGVEELGELVGRKFTGKGDVDRARELVALSDGIEQTRALAQEFADKAVAAISGFPDCEAKEGLVEMPTCAVIAYKNPSLQVTIVDQNAERINAWKSTELPIYEPGLNHIVSVARDGTVSPSDYISASSGPMLVQATNNGNIFGSGSHREESPGSSDLAHAPNLFFTTDMAQAIAEADLIFICVNTPTKDSGIGKDYACDLKYFEAATRKIAEVAVTNKIVVEKSTVPCRTAQSMREILVANCNPGVEFEVLSNPEFLSEGSAVSDLLNPDRILIGSDPSPAGVRAAANLSSVYSWVPRDRIIFMNLWSSELSKLAANALLAQRISSINALSAICEATGANINDVSYACGLDRRIGPHMLNASAGFGGSCFRKDILNLVYLAESFHLSEVANYWRSVVAMNEYQKCRFTQRIINCLFGTLTDKKITVLGISYKKDTRDTREAPAITLVRNILAEKCKISIYDPQVSEKQIWEELVEDGGKIEELKKGISVHHDVYDACEGADAVVVATDWDEFSNKDVTLPSLSAWTPSAIFRGGRPNRNYSHTPTSLVARGEPSADHIPQGISILGGVGTPTRPTASIDTILDSSGSPSRISRGSTRGSSPPNLRRRQDSLVSSLSAESNDNQIGMATLSNDFRDGCESGMNRLDWGKVALGMRQPMFVFDGRSILDAAKLERLGFRVEAIGVPRTGYQPAAWEIN